MSHFIKTLSIAALGACAILAHADTKLGPYEPVTDARLINPEAKNWLMYRGNYQGWGYSPLEKINSKNVKKLDLAWSFSTGVTEGHQSPPHCEQRLYVHHHAQRSGDCFECHYG